jgi:hypothetical protein
MSLHTFHGHFFVRSTDLLSLPNVNPDAGFGMQVHGNVANPDPGSGAFFDPWIRDLGWVKNQDPDPG